MLNQARQCSLKTLKSKGFLSNLQCFIRATILNCGTKCDKPLCSALLSDWFNSSRGMTSPEKSAWIHLLRVSFRTTFWKLVNETETEPKILFHRVDFGKVLSTPRTLSAFASVHTVPRVKLLRATCSEFRAAAGWNHFLKVLYCQHRTLSALASVHTVPRVKLLTRNKWATNSGRRRDGPSTVLPTRRVNKSKGGTRKILGFSTDSTPF